MGEPFRVRDETLICHPVPPALMIITDSARAPHVRVLDRTMVAEILHPKHFKGRLATRYSIAHARLPVGEASLPHTLLSSSEVYVILQGTGLMHTGTEEAVVHPGELVYIPPGTVQYIENTGGEELVFLAIVDPCWRGEDEILGTPAGPDTAGNADRFLDQARVEAETGLSEGGIPIGSVLVRNGEIIASGHNRRVQDGNPMAHAEIDCLVNAGRRADLKECTLYSTLMPCYLCAGAVVQFGIRTVIVGESQNFTGAREFMEAHGVRVTDLADPRCISMMETYIRENPNVWNEDIGV